MTDFLKGTYLVTPNALMQNMPAYTEQYIIPVSSIRKVRIVGRYVDIYLHKNDNEIMADYMVTLDNNEEFQDSLAMLFNKPVMMIHDGGIK